MLDTPLTTLVQWQEKAIQFDRQKRMDQAVEQDIQARQGNRPNPRPSPPTPTNRPSPTVNLPRYPTPRPNYPNLSAPRYQPPANVTTQPRPGTTGPMDVERNKQPIRCYGCGQLGHMQKNCPRPAETTRQARAMIQEMNEEQRTTLLRELSTDTTQNNANTEPPQEGFPSAQQ